MSSSNGINHNGEKADVADGNVSSSRKRQLEEATSPTPEGSGHKATPVDKKSKKHDLDDYDENTGDGSSPGHAEGAVYDVDDEEEDFEENGAHDDVDDDDEDDEDDDFHEGDEDDDEDLEDLPERFQHLHWEDDYVVKMAKFVGENGGKLLQIGYGTGIASQTFHTCDHMTELYVVEDDDELYDCLEAWASEYPDIVCIKGSWDDGKSLEEFSDGEFDGILFYSHPMGPDQSPDKGAGDAATVKSDSHLDFISRYGYRLLKKGGHLSYCNIRAWGDHLKQDKYQNDVMKMFQETQLEALKKIGFTEDHIEIELEDVSVPEDVSYYAHEQVTLVKLTK